MEARKADFTNEGGVEGTIRFLKNVMGLWVLSECVREWQEGGDEIDLPELLSEAGAVPALTSVVDVDDPSLLPPRDMPGRLRRLASTIAGVRPEVVHVVGGGSQNELLCQLTADACGLTVVAGPTEAAALGNVLVQARTLGEKDLYDLEEMRALLRRTQRLTLYEPSSDDDWDAAEGRLRGRVGS